MALASYLKPRQVLSFEKLTGKPWLRIHHENGRLLALAKSVGESRF